MNRFMSNTVRDELLGGRASADRSVLAASGGGRRVAEHSAAVAQDSPTMPIAL
ncbi:MAG: hypothetical protein LBH84_05725 [Prevotellaceae bacterium]|nr:hypothetical protein [Prevotellaceae bacterium]